MKNNKKFCFVILFCLFFLFLGLLIFESQIKKEKFYTKSIKKATYSSAITFEPTKINFDIKKYFEISYKFRVNDFNKYSNVFQTADKNNGLRFEINHDTHNGILILLNKKKQLLEFPVGEIEPFSLHTIKIIYTNDTIFLTFDGKTIQTSNVGDFKVNNILLGQGFNKGRIFKGEIQDFQIKYCESELPYGTYNNIKICKSVIIFLCLFILMYIYIPKFNLRLKNIIIYSFIGLIISFIGLNLFQYKILCNEEFFIPEYDSTSSNNLINQPFYKKFENNNIKNLLKDICVSFDFKINDINEHDDIFQTSDLNKGIRAELNKKGFLGFILADKSMPGKKIGFQIQKLEKNKIYQIKIIKNNSQKLKISLNSKPFKTYDYITNDFDVDNIYVGQGFNETRKFNGQIKNFKITYKTKIITPWQNMFKFLTLFFFIVFILSVIRKIIKKFF